MVDVADAVLVMVAVRRSVVAVRAMEALFLEGAATRTAGFADVLVMVLLADMLVVVLLRSMVGRSHLLKPR